MLAIASNVDLRPYNTLAISVRAAYFVQISDEKELTAALKWVKSKALPLMVIGGGSNIVLTDDFPGLVLLMSIKGISIVKENKQAVWLAVGAGENWHDLVVYCLKRHYYGLENLALIPGKVGAAPIQNIGAYGLELSDRFVELQAIDNHSGVKFSFDKAACQFAYRDSVFKRQARNRYTITTVTCKLFKKAHIQLTYPSLQAALASDPRPPSPALIFEHVCRIRRTKLPQPELLPNVGSFFKNPVISLSELERLQQRYPTLVSFPTATGQVKLAAAWLIEQAGWRGYRSSASEGGVSVHRQHALVLLNADYANGKQVLALAEKIQASVAQRFGILLEIEPQIYPAFLSDNSEDSYESTP